MSFCMETGKLEMLFQRNYDCNVHPYIMCWPSALIGNEVNPQLEGASVNCTRFQCSLLLNKLFIVLIQLYGL
jgi:hypothetical protein